MPRSKKSKHKIESKPDSKADKIAFLACYFEEFCNRVDNLNHKHLSLLILDPVWGFLVKMQNRAIEQTRASVLLLGNNYFAPAEALCRTAFEAILNFYYCSSSNTNELILCYLKSYIENERKETGLWDASIKNGLNNEEVDQHRSAIQQKKMALDIYKETVSSAFQEIGLNYDASKGNWPSVYERYTAIKHESGYRTIYAALCSQTHNDAEDLLNDFISKCCDDSDCDKALKLENANFAVLMTIIVFRLLIESTINYFNKYKINSTDEFDKIHSGLLGLIDERPFQK